MRPAAVLAVALLGGCGAPTGAVGSVGFRPHGDEPQSGERGSVRISEVLWSGSLTDQGQYDLTDVFIEFRNESTTPLDMTGWRVVEKGAIVRTWILPAGGPTLDVGAHAFAAAKNTGCFPNPDWVLPGLDLGGGDPFELTLLDADERLIEPVGSREDPPFAGGYDLVRSRSMEKSELMFGGEGSQPAVWHFYTPAAVDVPNDDRVADNCRGWTGASPGRANSPDYSGAYASGSFE